MRFHLRPLALSRRRAGVGLLKPFFLCTTKRDASIDGARSTAVLAHIGPLRAFEDPRRTLPVREAGEALGGLIVETHFLLEDLEDVQTFRFIGRYSKVPRQSIMIPLGIRPA